MGVASNALLRRPGECECCATVPSRAVGPVDAYTVCAVWFGAGKDEITIEDYHSGLRKRSFPGVRHPQHDSAIADLVHGVVQADAQRIRSRRCS